MTSAIDCVVIGSGPNGLAAAVVLARAGLSVEVFESQSKPGGGLRTADLTRSGSLHDVCSAVHPMAYTSPFFKAFGLSQRVEYRRSDVSFAHAVHPDHAVLAYRDLERTAAGLGIDANAYRRVLQPLVDQIDFISEMSLDTLLRWPRNLRTATDMASRTLGMSGMWSERLFRHDDALALLTGAAAHANTRLPSLGSAAIGLVLSAHAHADGWPIPVGGSGTVADAMIADIEAHGGRVTVGRRVDTLADVKYARIVVADTSARGLLRIAHRELPMRYQRSLRQFRYGAAVAKIDAVLDGPIPWAAAGLDRATTVHVGGTSAETRESENAVQAGRYPSKPFILVAQPTHLDDSRTSKGRHILWAYTHVPSGSRRDMSKDILDRLETFAPGLKKRIVVASSKSGMDGQSANENYVGGDIYAGESKIWQLLARPVLSRQPWRTPVPGLYLASSSAVPGPGIHGMGGMLAARTALADLGIPFPALGLAT